MAKFAVIGLGKFGMTVATTLFENGAEVIAIDQSEKLVEEVKGRVTAPVKLDSTDERALKSLGIQDVDAVILAIGNNIEVSVLTSVILKNMGAGPIYAKVDSRIHGRILEMIGVHHVVFPEEQIGIQIAQSLISSNVIDYVNLSTGHILVEMVVPEEYVGKRLLELSLPTEKGVNVIAIKYDELTISEDGENVIERHVNDMPGANDIINNGDTIVLLGPKSKINSLINETAKKRR